MLLHAPLWLVSYVASALRASQLERFFPRPSAETLDVEYTGVVTPRVSDGWIMQAAVSAVEFGKDGGAEADGLQTLSLPRFQENSQDTDEASCLHSETEAEILLLDASVGAIA